MPYAKHATRRRPDTGSGRRNPFAWIRRSLQRASHDKKSVLRNDFPAYYVYMHTPGKPVWSPKDYRAFADEGYARNVVAYQAVQRIATAVSSVPWRLKESRTGTILDEHPLLMLLERPAPGQSGAQFIQNLIGYRLISGNAYILRVGPKGAPPMELHLLRPDRVQVIAGKDMLPAGYRYTVDNAATDYPVNSLTGDSAVLHLKSFHPSHDWYGMSPIEAAAYSIDQHNQAGEWNQSLLQNGARPCGALVMQSTESNPTATISDEQFRRLKEQVDVNYVGPSNAGRPLLLEGGLEWQEMSISPRDMDFISTKHSAARDIALAFGLPPQLLGIPGDNTYANLAEARLAFWEQTVIPMLDTLRDALNGWLTLRYDRRLYLTYDLDGISALSPRREQLWSRLKDCDFLTPDEKRAMVGLGRADG